MSGLEKDCDCRLRVEFRLFVTRKKAAVRVPVGLWLATS
jgi:hypothetical protein